MRRMVAAAAVAAILFLAVPAGRAGEVKTLRFGVCLSLTGEFSAAGKKALAGLRLRLDDFNASAAATGLRLEPVIRDDRSDPNEAIRVFDELAEKEKVPAVIGPLATNLMLGMRERAAVHEVVLLSPSCTSPRIGRNGDWAFRLLFDDEFQGVALARFLAGKGLVRAGAVVNDRLAYAPSVYRAFKRTLEEEGGRIVREEHYEWVANEERMYDFTDIVRRLDEADPDIVLLPVNSTEITAIVSQSTLLGAELRFCGGDTWQHENILMAGGNNLEHALFVSGVDYDADTPEMRRYRHLYDHSNDPDLQLSSVLGYDAMSLLIEAFKGGHDSHAVKKALYGIKNFKLATGTITIHPERGSEKTAYIHEIHREEDGDFVAAIIDQVRP